MRDHGPTTPRAAKENAKAFRIFAPNTRLHFIGDRESDASELMKMLVEDGHNFTIRANQERKALVGVRPVYVRNLCAKQLPIVSVVDGGIAPRCTYNVVPEESDPLNVEVPIFQTFPVSDDGKVVIETPAEPFDSWAVAAWVDSDGDGKIDLARDGDSEACRGATRTIDGKTHVLSLLQKYPLAQESDVIVTDVSSLSIDGEGGADVSGDKAVGWSFSIGEAADAPIE